MTIMPADGWTNLNKGSEEGCQPVSGTVCCPACQSDDWKAASLVFREGISTVSSKTKGTIIGISRAGFRNGHTSIGGGRYQSRTSGVQQTALSGLAAPPQMRSGLILFLAILCILFLCGMVGFFNSADYFHASIDILIVGILTLTAIVVYQKRRGIYDQQMSKYANTRMCQRCGTFYVPKSHSRVDSVVSPDQINLRAVMLVFFILFFAVTFCAGLFHDQKPRADANTNTPISSAPLVSQQPKGIAAQPTEPSSEASPTDGLPDATTQYDSTSGTQNSTTEQLTETSVNDLPKPTNYVSDFAHKLSPETVELLNKRCSNIDRQTETQVAIVTINTLNGADLADYAKELFNKWGIGHKGTSRGVLLLLAVTDRKFRITVGTGLEQVLTNAKAHDIGQAMVPKLKTNDFDAATTMAVDQVEQVVGLDTGVSSINMK